MSAENTNNPFVGLRPFESDETLLFFGRQQQTLELLRRLHQFNFVGVTGTSGSGKSSLVRAGVIPRLKAGYLVNDRDHWIICILRPGQNPMINLAHELRQQFPQISETITTHKLVEKLELEGIDGLIDLLTPALGSNGNLFLLVDQFEEIFRFSINQQDYEKKDEAIEFVNLLLQLSQKKDLPAYITITMRSDFVGDCAQIHGLPEALNESQYLVPRLTRQQLKSAIEGPIRLFKGSINNGLTSRLLNDVTLVNDELPLLQHALMRMWERDQQEHKGEMTLEDYESIGGLTKALSNHADQALEGMSPQDKILTQKIFQALTGIDEKGRKIRRPARLKELAVFTGATSQKVEEIIDRFIADNRNFLVKYTSEGIDDVMVDISHESLIRQWNILNKWVDKEADAAATYSRLIEACRLYKQGKKDLLTGNELQQMLEWNRTFKPAPQWASRYSADFVNHIKYLNKSELAYKQELARKKRNRIIAYATVGFIFLMVSAFAFYINKNNNHNKRQLALNYWNSSQSAREGNSKLDAIWLIAEAAVVTDDPDLNRDLLIDAQSFLPETELTQVVNIKTIVNHVSFSNDNRYFVTSGNNGTVKIFNSETCKQNDVSIKSDLPVNSAVFSRDGLTILTAGNDQAAHLYNASNGKQLMILPHSESVTSAVFSPDETKILTACADGTATEWDRKTGARLATYTHEAALTRAVYNSNGQMIATASNYFKATIWNTSGKNKVEEFEHNAEVTDIAFSPDDTLLLTTSRDSLARIWNIATHALVASLQHKDAVTCGAFNPKGNVFVTGCNDKKVRVWDLATMQQMGAGMLHDGRVYDIDFSGDGKWLLTTGRDGYVRKWQLTINENKPVSVFRHNTIVTSGAFNSKGDKILTTGFDSTAYLWDVTSGRQLFTLAHSGFINTACFSSDGSLVITASKDSMVHVWDAASGKEMKSFKMEAEANCAAISADKMLLFATDNKGNILLWNISSSAPVKQLAGTLKFKQASFSPDGKKVLLTGKDSSAYLLDINQLKLSHPLSHENLITSAAFNSDGTKIITTGEDMAAKIWDAVSLTQIGSNLTHQHAVINGSFSHNNNNWVVTGGWDKEVHLWSLLNYRQLDQLTFHSNAVTSVSFSPDNQFILSSGYDSVAIISDIAADLDLPPGLFQLQLSAITGTEYNLNKGEAECLSLKKWTRLQNEYQQKLAGHAENCRYLKYNFWHSRH